MDKLVESLRVLLENERDGVLHVDGERLRQAKYAGSVEALRKILDEDGWSAEKRWMQCENCWKRRWKNENMSNASFFYEAFGV